MEKDLKSALSTFAVNKVEITPLEFKQTLPQPVIDVLNTQIGNELYSANMYKAASSWFSNGPWSNAFKLFFKYGQEEMNHMDKIIEYLDDRNCKFVIPACVKPPADFKSAKDIFTAALEHEIQVTANWENISNVALANKDNTTHEFATWYLKEQTEEMVKIRELLYMYDLGMPDWMIEVQIGEILG